MSAPLIIELASLRQGDDSAGAFEGRDHGAPVSFFDVNVGVGGGVALHRHPYVEVWIIAEGEVMFRVGGDDQLARSGQVVVVPAEAPHCFSNTGSVRLRMTCVHASDRFETEWL